MLLPAVERAPVEVWLRIIRFALASPLSSAPGDDILDYREVFLTVCESDHAALAHENNVASFRLVCKSWAATVKQLRQRMILCDFGKFRRYGKPTISGGDMSKPEFVPLHLFQKPTPTPKKLPSATRVEAWTPQGYCYCFRPTCRYKKTSASRDHPARSLQEDPLLAARRGKSVNTITSLLVGMKVDEIYLRKLLDAMLSLRALSCRIRDRPIWETIFQRATCQGLTHLQVRVSWAPFCRSLSNIVLPELVYLGVVFHLPPGTSTSSNPPVDDVEWCPQLKLRYLELEGTLLECRRDEFYTFLAVDRPNVAGLILRVEISDHKHSEYYIPPNLWVSFPNLTSLGVEMVVLLVNSLPPAPSMISIDLILFFGTVDTWHYTKASTVGEFFESILWMYNKWKPKRIVLPTTWEAEEQFVKGFVLSACTKRPKAFYLPHYVQFFQVLKKEGITVVDREGNSTETVDGRRYVESLEMHGFDKYDSGHKLYEAWAEALPKVPFEAGFGGTCYRQVDSD